MAKNKWLDELEVSQVRSTLEDAYTYVENNHPKILKDIDEKKEITDENDKALNKAIKDYFALQKK